jgi:hypothetical protein
MTDLAQTARADRAFRNGRNMIARAGRRLRLAVLTVIRTVIRAVQMAHHKRRHHWRYAGQRISMRARNVLYSA